MACEVEPIGFGTTSTDIVVGGVISEVEPLDTPREDGEMDAVVEASRITLEIDRTYLGRRAPRSLTFDVWTRSCSYQRTGRVGDRLAFFVKRDGANYSLQFTTYEDEVAGRLELMGELRRR